MSGPNVFQFELIGYATRTDTVLVEQDRTIELIVSMARDPVDLPPIEVSVRSPRLIETGFYDRQYRSGLSGHYITRDQIENRNPRAMTDMFRGVPGVTVSYDGPGQRIIRFRRYPGDVRRARGDGCVPDLYVDGVLLQDQIIDRNNPYAPRLRDYDIVSPSVIEGIEVYVGAATPIQYKHPCGVVLVWTRR
jgi:hypothetical protein